MSVFVSGPMTGLPAFNVSAFHAAAAQLRAAGYEVENPAENPVPACGGHRLCAADVARLRRLLAWMPA